MSLTLGSRLTLKQQSVAPLLLDTYSGAAAAYSLRNLSWAYGGPVVRVRRSSDNTEQDFTASQITDGTLTAFCGAGNGFVRTWYDQSGNGINAAQTTTSLQPKIFDSSTGLFTVGGKPALSIASGNTFAFSTSAWAGLYLDITSVASITSYDTAGSMLLGSTGSPNHYWQFGNGSNFWNQGPASPGTGIAINDSTRRILNLHSTSTTQFARYNGNQYSDAEAVPAVGSGVRNYLLFTYPAGSGWNWIGTAQEIIIYPTIQSTNRAAIESNINAHYAIY